eukprot:Sspe_Gene.4801::Locus_1584_Transcript_1_1_Confidence_1.000_Length_496::g.4801::m.4801
MDAEALSRTIHISSVDTNAPAHEFANLIVGCGRVTNLCMSGDPSRPSTFGFVEYEAPLGAQTLMQRSGQVLGRFGVKCAWARSPIAQPPGPQNDIQALISRMLISDAPLVESLGQT